LNAKALAEAREKTLKGSLAGLKDMTLTVVDGDFPRELLAKQNLTFAEYRMPRKRNTPAAYDAKINRPAGAKPGILKLGAITPFEKSAVAASVAQPSTRWRLFWIVSVGLSLMGIFVMFRSRRLSNITA
ncbi:MAG: hypothetical protein IH991_24895, partial [Planctomycetes bacterium]|nr:hypothetical protein [Planctomycetota bacterium]